MKTRNKKRSEKDIFETEILGLGMNSCNEELREKGIYYITGEIVEDSLLEISQNILLKHMDPSWKEDIQLIINTVGGETAEGWALIDLLDWIKMDVRTIGLGTCCSLGAVLLAAGTKGKRVVAPNTSVMVHGAAIDGVGGTLQQLKVMTAEMEREFERDIKFWTTHSVYNTSDKVKGVFLDGNDHYYSSEEALAHGIVDSILAPSKKSLKKK